MINSIPFLLTVTACVIGTVLAIFYFPLKRRGLFNWTHAGFWAWAAFALYFVASPGSIVILGKFALYESRLSMAGGAGRAVWILFVAVAGISTFFFVYLRTPFKPIGWGIRQQSLVFTPPVLAVIILFLFIGFYSLLAHRAGLVGITGQTIIEGGRFTGDITGYEHVAHKFIFIPMLLFLLSRDPVFRGFGWLLAAIYFVFSLPHSGSRYITVSLFVALSVRYCLQTRRAWPKVAHILIIVVVAMMFQIRGHVKWELNSGFQTAIETLLKIPEQGLKVLGATSDTAMLANWYLKSAIEDHYIGYDYGLPFINYVITGWIPSRFFPQKYFLVDWMASIRGGYSPVFMDGLLYGAKYTLLGSFYGHGGITALILCMGGAGYLFRRLDGMLSSESPHLIKATGISLLSTLWMDWGSSDSWVLVNWGSMAIPGLVLWLFWRKAPTRKRFAPFIRQRQGVC